MQILDWLKRYRETSRLRAQTRRAPTPRAFGALAERHVAHGHLDDALQTAEEGLERFPDSERLHQIRIFVKKKALAGRLRSLRQDAARRPSPFVFTSLAELHRELDDEDEALAIATQSGTMFPQNAQPFLVQGEIRLERFLRDQVAKDAVQGAAALRRAVRIDPTHLKAHLLLAELYHLIGAATACRVHLREVLEHSPSNRDVRAFLRQLGGDAEDTGSSAEDLSQDELTELAIQVEETGVFAGPPEAFPQLVAHTSRARRHSTMRVDLGRLTAALAVFSGTPGVCNAMLLDGEGQIVAQHGTPDALDPEAFADLVRAVRSTADDASRRMDTGVLVRAEIEGPATSLTVLRMRRYTVATLFQDPLRTDRVWEMLQDVTARCLAPPREVAHA